MYTISQVNVHTRYPYYGGLFSVQSQTFPVCFVFDTAGTFVINLDGFGTCPTQTDPATCIQSGTRVVQTWTGAFYCEN